MKIVHVVNYIQPLLGYQEYFLAKEHASLGHEVTVITSDRYFPFPDYENTVEKTLGKRFLNVGTYDQDGFKIIRLPTIIEIGTKVWHKGLFGILKKLSPELVICHGMDNFNSLRLAGYKNKLAFMLIYDDHTIRPIVSGVRKLFYKMFNFEKILKYGDRFIVVSEACIEYASKYYRVPANRLELIPLGADSEMFKKNEKERERLRKFYSMNEDDIVIIYTGKLIEEKGVHYILHSLNKIKFDKNLFLFVVGNGDCQYLNLLKNINLNKNINLIVIDMVPNFEVSKYYSMSDIAVWPVGQTNGTTEAMSCSLPIICTNNLKEKYQGGNGFGVEPGNIEELTEKIQYLMNNKNIRLKMGNMGRQIIDNKLSWKKTAERFLD